MQDTQESLNKINLIEGKNQGCCNARNLGIEKAKGDVIVFLTADTILPINYLNKILKLNDLNEDCLHEIKDIIYFKIF